MDLSFFPTNKSQAAMDQAAEQATESTGHNDDGQRSPPGVLTWVLGVLVTVHLVVTIAVPILLIYEAASGKFLQDVFYLWLRQPILVALCVFLTKSKSAMERRLVYADVGLSVLQIISINLLYAMVDHIG